MPASELAAARAEIAKLQQVLGKKSMEWAAARSIDTEVSCLNLLELYGTEIAEFFTEGLMPSTGEYPVWAVKRSLAWSDTE